ncbi:Arylsulfatase [Novipirellula aureliae]|uniref:Arylsulfatase n=1 Tax=Novipirellula aureliae TaxID=2527966 RepID=A0A5C6DNY4_9BACT|nr:sulfatase [Novipirellula aureliae]TWU37925.1 Arylsulfatase [Novipirellula aureliae]
MVYSRLILCLLFAASLCGAPTQAAPQAAQKSAPKSALKSPNFILILTDDQSWVGSSLCIDPDDKRTSSDFYQTPNIERLASLGMRFTQGYAPAPYCCPTRRSIQIGQSSARHLDQKDQPGWTEYYKQQPTIPKSLKAIDPNYRTAHFGKWDFRYDGISPAAIGYDISDGPTGNGEGGGPGTDWPAAKEDPKLIDYLTERTCRFMADCSDEKKPFYVQLSHYAVHLGVYYKQATLDRVAKRQKGTNHNIAEFAAMTEDMDTGIGRVLDKVKELGLDDSTYIIFMSDNGGRKDIPGFESDNLNLPLRGNKGNMYEGGIRVPFIVSGPAIQAGSISHVPVSGVDLLPTITDLAGQQLQHNRLDGGSLKSLLNGQSETVKRNNDFLIFHQAVIRKPQTAILKGNYKLVKTWDGNKLELFDLSNDLAEAQDLSNEMPEKTEELHQRMVAYLDKVNAATEYMGSKSQIYKLWGKTRKKSEDE